MTFKVETDLDQISGLSTFDVNSYSKVPYIMNVKALIGGVYTG